MTTTQPLYPTRIDVQVDLGPMFATLHASVLGDGRAVGAHVDLDGTPLGDTGLVPLHGDEPLYVARMLRAVMVGALSTAHAEIGVAVDVDEVRRVVAKALPLIPIIEAMVAAEAEAAA